MENVTLKGIAGTWYEIDRTWIDGKEYILFESEQEGEDLPGIITDIDLHVILLSAFNGFADIED